MHILLEVRVLGVGPDCGGSGWFVSHRGHLGLAALILNFTITVGLI
jgi:hypothetical protein